MQVKLARLQNLSKLTKLKRFFFAYQNKDQLFKFQLNIVVICIPCDFYTYNDTFVDIYLPVANNTFVHYIYRI